MDLPGKHALVTGGNDGIGRQIALQLRARQASVTVVGRNAATLAEMSGHGFATIEADLSTPAGIDRVIDALGDQPLDLLINNAGMGASYDVDTGMDLIGADATIFLNLNAPIHLITRLLPRLRERPRAMIVNVTSGLAIAPSGSSPVYCATKAALRSFSMALRSQLRHSNVDVLEALPPVVETRMTAENRHKKMPASECARRIVGAIERDRNYAYVGQAALLNAVYTLSPTLARSVMLRY